MPPALPPPRSGDGTWLPGPGSSVSRKGLVAQEIKRSRGCRSVAVRRGWHRAGWVLYAWLVLCRLLRVLSFAPRVDTHLLCTFLPWLELEQECCHCDSSPIGMVLGIHCAVNMSHIYKVCGMHLGCGWILPEQAAAPAELPGQGGAAGKGRGAHSGVCSPSAALLEWVVVCHEVNPTAPVPSCPPSSEPQNQGKRFQKAAFPWLQGFFISWRGIRLVREVPALF